MARPGPRATAWLARSPRIVVERLPDSTPDLSPAEAVWSHTAQGDLATFAPATLAALETAGLGTLSDTRTERDLLRRSSGQRG